MARDAETVEGDDAVVAVVLPHRRTPEEIGHLRQLRDGGEADMRRAYAMPRDEDTAGVGPIDPQIGLLRLDHEDGRPLAVVYNFACHPVSLHSYRNLLSPDFVGYTRRKLSHRGHFFRLQNNFFKPLSFFNLIH